MRHNQKGFTLPELLIGLAISSIIIGASFGSYIVIKNNYDFQKDMKNISQSSRAVATMIMRDVRLAGYNFDDGPGKQNPLITTPVKITDGGTTGPDSIEVIYDQSFTERLKISYYSKPYPNTNSQRSRLYKKVERCDPSVNCSAGSLVTVIPESPIADYVEDLQFTGSKNGNALGTGGAVYGQGNLRTITSADFTVTARQSDIFTGFAQSGDAAYAFDNSLNTMWSCNIDIGKECGGIAGVDLLTVNFNKEVRLEKIFFWNGANTENGTEAPGDVASGNYTGINYPWGKEHAIFSKTGFRINATKCAWSSPCTPVGNKTSQDYDIYGSYHEINVDSDYQKSVIKSIGIRPSSSAKCSYSGTTCNGADTLRWHEIAEIQFYGEVFGEPQDPQEVEIGLLIRSPEQHGSTPLAQTWNVGNRPISTNDNYIRDAYSISALVRNKYYE